MVHAACMISLNTEVASKARLMSVGDTFQGDVGCGKTVVAFMALLAAAGSGYQAAMMLPTEILASQTHAKLRQLLDSLPEELQPNLAILTGSAKTKERREVREVVLRSILNGSGDLTAF